MKAADIRKYSTPDLEKKIVEYKKELFNLRFQLAIGQLENTARIKKVRKIIARMNTIITLREKEI